MRLPTIRIDVGTREAHTRAVKADGNALIGQAVNKQTVDKVVKEIAP